MKGSLRALGTPLRGIENMHRQSPFPSYREAVRGLEWLHKQDAKEKEQKPLQQDRHVWDWKYHNTDFPGLHEYDD